jgi:hypothetical protein
MATILSIDAPDEFRALDARLDKPGTLGRIALSLIFAAAAPVVLVMALIGHDLMGVFASIVWFLLWTGWLFPLYRKIKASRRFRVRIVAGQDAIREAHAIYNRLNPESSSQEYALPLIKTMYQISVIPVQGEYGVLRLENLMRERVHALRGLLAAEDEVALASAAGWTRDRDDMDAVTAYQDALNEVAAKLNYTL